MSVLQVGDLAPDFEAPVAGGDYQTGQKLKLSDLLGEVVVLYFYPKDDTPGCTTQACDIRDNYDAVSQRCKIFGISVDSIAKHEKFLAKYALPFPLWSDEDQQIVEKYDVWVEKSMYGKKYFGVERSTFVVGRDGKLAAIIRKVKPAEHVKWLEENLPE